MNKSPSRDCPFHATVEGAGETQRISLQRLFLSPAVVANKDSYFVVNLSKNALVRTNLSADCVGFT